jgi:hypothetical protein
MIATKAQAKMIYFISFVFVFHGPVGCMDRLCSLLWLFDCQAYTSILLQVWFKLVTTLFMPANVHFISLDDLFLGFIWKVCLSSKPFLILAPNIYEDM